MADILTTTPGTTAALLQRPEESCAFVIFGASGDLTSRKLVPALYNLACQDLLPPGFAVQAHELEDRPDRLRHPAQFQVAAPSNAAGMPWPITSATIRSRHWSVC